jgi:hypothetical protein
MILLYIFNKLTKKDRYVDIPDDFEEMRNVSASFGLDIPMHAPDEFAALLAHEIRKINSVCEATVVECERLPSDPWDAMKYVRQLVQQKKGRDDGAF